MGHQRLGRLPASRLLPEIVRYLVEGGTPTADLVEQITEFGRDTLKHAIADPGFIEALWLLIRFPQAVADRTYPESLRVLGMPERATRSLSDILVYYDNCIEAVQRHSHQGLTDLGEMARQAGLASLAEAVQRGMPSLWSPSADDVKSSLASLRSAEAFGALAHGFFANFVERGIHYYVDRNLHHMVGTDRVASSIFDLETFNRSIRRHCDEAAVIMRAFAKDWLGKNHYRDGREILRDDVRKFSAYVVEKIGSELEMRRGVN